MGNSYNRNRYLKNRKDIINYCLKKYYENKERIINPKVIPIVNIKMEKVVLDFS